MRFAAVLVLLVACADEPTIPSPSPDAAQALGPMQAPGTLGTVYTCSVPDKAGWVNEWCWVADPYELEQRTGTANCYPTQGVPQCRYNCPSTADCIALDGCYCP